MFFLLKLILKKEAANAALALAMGKIIVGID
jgi:hypothetical protein